MIIVSIIILKLFNFIVTFIDSSPIDLPSLTILSIGDYSFQILTQYEIEGRLIKELNNRIDLPVLTELKVGEHSCVDVNSFRLSSKWILSSYSIDLPKLTSFTTGWGSFISVSDILLAGIREIDLMIQ